MTYSLKTPPSGGTVQFDDVVEYYAKSTSARSRVVGVDTLIVDPLDSSRHSASASKPAQTRYNWRGRGWLFWVTSRWQILGCSADPSPENAGAWAVTYFAKTLFTPEGLDLYCRSAEGLPADVVAEILGKAKGLGGNVARLAEQFFEVERSGIGGADSTT